MLAFITGICFGLALGWISYIKHASLVSAFFIYIGSACTVFYFSVVVPTATASGVMDMGLLEFVVYALDFYFGDFWSLAMSWMILGVAVARILAEIGYNAFEPVDIDPETRDESRRRVRADMKYSDDYFD
ncbi:hypothetical protein GCM10009069_22320 [Algimonas arctica]|uniref:Uncharacterized protein n=1 Tax=Algimonas arctica TaxID=1479486 RepID=A0A8J3G320_9PROT|nr:hypothetical protein [Algimonas arctica]GHA98900.1 hypothetical protein GCM10009069_22320 [Algimonas arctica]